MPVENLEFYWNKDSLSLIAVSLGTLSWPLITAELDEITEINIVVDSQIAKPRFTENDVSASRIPSCVKSLKQKINRVESNWRLRRPFGVFLLR